jgi:hypothetical protein
VRNEGRKGEEGGRREGRREGGGGRREEGGGRKEEGGEKRKPKKAHTPVFAVSGISIKIAFTESKEVSKY